MKEISTSNQTERQTNQTRQPISPVAPVSRVAHVPQSERIHIGLLGRRNAGKSSLLNALVGQDVALVSDTPGTTTDPVFKAMELQPLGPVVFVDTAGLDDEGKVGTLRVERTRKVLRRLDMGLLVVDATLAQQAMADGQPIDVDGGCGQEQEQGYGRAHGKGYDDGHGLGSGNPHGQGHDNGHELGCGPDHGERYGQDYGPGYGECLAPELAILNEFRRCHPTAPVLMVWNKIDQLKLNQLQHGDGRGKGSTQELNRILAQATAFLQSRDQHRNPYRGRCSDRSPQLSLPFIGVSARTGQGISQLKERIREIAQQGGLTERVPLVEDLVAPGDTVILVTPIDSEAPAGRLILPQQQVLRALLDHGVVTLVVRETELAAALDRLRRPPSLVITDSQAFAQVVRVLPPNVPLTSFSILFARYKGDLEQLLAGANAVSQLRPGDRVLVAEACTHSPPTEVDIGRVKIPRLLETKVGGKLEWTWFTGYDFPAELQTYRLVIHCGGCMLNRTEMQSRLQMLRQAGVPVVNYGVILAYLTGILPRAVEPLRLPGR
ncbi:MAG: [FeFe] hydrogenase H-cluster maturation GTPase HydF [Limnochordaceae bacterium]|nr:[FeFe] hydrogenase H-cluster maturation GTPase HydF [Limnochordaceae bacterium]